MVCIYKILNTINENFYIGSTINFVKRKAEHIRLLNKNKHHSIVLQNAWNKYGSDCFVFIVVEKCNIDEKLAIEQKYIDQLCPEYNISINSSAPMQGRKHSIETLEKFKNRKYKLGKEHHLYGKPQSLEQRKQRALGRLGKKHSTRTKLKMSETGKKLNRGDIFNEYIQLCRKKIVDNNGIIHDSLSLAAKYYNMSVQSVCDILKGRSKQSKKGIIFKYVNT